MGSLGSYYSNKYSARSALAQGSAAKAAYDQSARNKETEAEGANRMAARNRMTMRRNQSAAMASARMQRGASGLTSEGSGMVAERSVAERYGKAVADQMVSAAINDQNQRYAASMLRWQGDAAMVAARNQAAAYRSAAEGALVQLAVQAGGAVVGGALAASEAGADASFGEVAKAAGKGGMNGFSIGSTASSWLPGATAEWNSLGNAQISNWMNGGMKKAGELDDESIENASTSLGVPTAKEVPAGGVSSFAAPDGYADGTIPPWLMDDYTGLPQVPADEWTKYPIPDETGGSLFPSRDEALVARMQTSPFFPNFRDRMFGRRRS